MELTKEQYEKLKQIAKSDCHGNKGVYLVRNHDNLNKLEWSDEQKLCIFLYEKQFIEPWNGRFISISKTINRGNKKQEIFHAYKITENGKMYLFERRKRNSNTIWEWIRYGITTAIAVGAAIAAIIALTK